jgi:uncharacterized membrane protein
VIPKSRSSIGLRTICAAVIAVCCSQLAATQPPQSAHKSPPRKILYFEGLPRPEMKFIRRAVDGAANLTLVTLQRTADGKYLRFDVEGPSDLVNGFPSTREGLFKYQGVILGSADASVFTADQQSLLADFVTVRGGGLLVLGGEQSFAEGGWLETPLSYLLPIAFDPNRNRQSARLSFKVSVRPTDIGIDHPALRISDAKHSATSMWQELPPVTLVNAVYPRSGADILLSGYDRTGREQVVLAVQQHGAGRVVAFTPQDSWVWVMNPNVKVNNPAHQRFWRVLLTWLVDGVS